MLLERAKEEIILLKVEMKQHLMYLASVRSLLLKNIVSHDNTSGENEYLIGKSVLSGCEISRLGVKIQECLRKFKMYSESHFLQFISNEYSTPQIADDSESGTESDSSDNFIVGESTESEDSDELDEANDSESDETSESDKTSESESDETSESDDGSTNESD